MIDQKGNIKTTPRTYSPENPPKQKKMVFKLLLNLPYHKDEFYNDF